jgi:hypothetical protein
MPTSCYTFAANGKSGLMATVAGILGEYHKTAAIETFTATSADRIFKRRSPLSRAACVLRHGISAQYSTCSTFAVQNCVQP